MLYQIALLSKLIITLAFFTLYFISVTLLPMQYFKYEHQNIKIAYQNSSLFHSLSYTKAHYRQEALLNREYPSYIYFLLVKSFQNIKFIQF